ncbi:MAG: RnfH family protein, partial [Pseudomonas sp.]
VRMSGIAEQVPGLDIEACPLGIFGKVVSDSAQQVVAEGDRIELYRPLLVDPKEIRKQRAAKVARVFKKAKR